MKQTNKQVRADNSRSIIFINSRVYIIMDGGGGYSARNGARDAPLNRPASTGSTLGVVIFILYDNMANILMVLCFIINYFI